MHNIFENLFVLELANNHWGNIDRGKKIIHDYGTVVRQNSVKASIKLQFRDVNNFIHPEFSGNQDIRYIKKTEATKLALGDFAKLVDEINNVGCIPMATPFDEVSVEWCQYFDFPVIKVASSDVNDWPLLEKIASTKKPVIVSSGGASEKNLDEMVSFFQHRNIDLAINHCVSLYPSEDHELELNQIDYLRNRYPGHVIGFSTHEQYDWKASMYLSYAKGARTWERHIDIDYDDVPVSPYCSLPYQVDEWFKAFHKAKEMCGGPSDYRRVISKGETEYLDALVRGIYAKRPLEKGYVINQSSFNDDFYMAVPLLKGQLSVREIINGVKITKPVNSNDPLMIDSVDGPYANDARLRSLITNRGYGESFEA